MSIGLLSPPRSQAVDWVCPINWQNPLNRGLVAWWLSLAGSHGGRTLHDLCRRANGTLTNMDPITDWVASPRGVPSLTFDGSDDRVVVADNPLHDGFDDFTIMFTCDSVAAGATTYYWAKYNTTGNQRSWSVLNPSGTTIRYNLSANGTAFSGVANMTLSGSGPFCVVLTRTGDALAGYINGVSQGITDTFSGTLFASTADMTIGCRSDASAFQAYRGWDYRLWRRALNASEVARCYQDLLLNYPSTLRRVRSGGAAVEVVPQEEGPNSLAAWSSVIGTGSSAWNNPSNAGASDNSYADSTGFSGTPTYALVKLVVGGVVSGNSFSAGESFDSDDGTYKQFGGAGETGGLSLTGADVKASDFGVVIQATLPVLGTTTHLKGLDADFSAIPDDADVTGILIEVEDGVSGANPLVDHVRMTVYWSGLTPPSESILLLVSSDMRGPADIFDMRG